MSKSRKSKRMSRREFLRTTGVAMGLAGLSLARFPEQAYTQGEEKDLIFVSNTGDQSVSIIDAATDEVIKTIPVRTDYTWPSNQWLRGGNFIWAGLQADKSKEVRILDVQQGKVIKKIETGSARNYLEVTPDGEFAIVAAREVDKYFKIGANPNKPTFAEIVAELKAPDKSEPCDMTIDLTGSFAYGVEVGTDTFAVIDIKSFTLLSRVPVPPVVAKAGEKVRPFMATASRDGRFVFVENLEAGGTESIFDVRNPAKPVEIKRLTEKDGLGKAPQSDEFTFDGKFNFIINRDSSTISVVELASLNIVNTIEVAPGGNPITGDFSNDGKKFYVSVQNKGIVVVIDVATQKVIKNVKVGPGPIGVVALTTTVPLMPGVALGSLPIVNDPRLCTLPCCGERG